MSDEGTRPGRSKRDGEKPALTCAICNRRYQALQTPGMQTIYSICPDCRLTGTTPVPRDEAV